jgi:hypothetical protein
VCVFELERHSSGTFGRAARLFVAHAVVISCCIWGNNESAATKPPSSWRVKEVYISTYNSHHVEQAISVKSETERRGGLAMFLRLVLVYLCYLQNHARYVQIPTCAKSCHTKSAEARSMLNVENVRDLRKQNEMICSIGLSSPLVPLRKLDR